MTKPVRLPRHSALRVTEIAGKGRGVVAGVAIRNGEILEIAPVILIRSGEQPPRGSILYDYPFKWDVPPYVEAIALGVLSMCNHSTDPNCDVDLFTDRRLVQLNAIRDIAAGEELTFDYGVSPWWEGTHLMRVAVLVPPRTEGMRFDQEDTFVQADEVGACLRMLGHDVVEAEYADHGARTETAIQRVKPDIVLNLVEEVPEGAAFLHLPTEMLDRLGVRYTGARTRTIAALGDKRAMKRELRRAGIPTALTLDEAPDDSTFIVKSAMEHASVGLDALSVVRGAEAARALMANKKAEFGGEWFAETYIEGREFDVAIVEGKDGPVVFPPAEITFEDRKDNSPRIYNFASKWAEGTDEYEAALRIFPAREEPLFSELDRIALACWHLFGLSGFSHIEFRVDAQTGNPYVLEVNANPCLTREAGYIMAAEAGGWTQTEIVAALLAAA